MEIRNALQKIENYLTVVSNLNRTILSEGTMSRDELLLMKKYLYTSIDRIEDIERLLMIDQNDNKSFVPTASKVENTVTTPKEKEIVAVQETEHIADVESSLSVEQQVEMDDLVEEIHAEIAEEKIEVIGEIKSVKEETVVVEKIEAPALVAPIENTIITEDYAINKLDDVQQLVQQEKVEQKVNETSSFVDSIITEDYSLNNLFATPNEEKTVSFEAVKLEENTVSDETASAILDNKTVVEEEVFVMKLVEETPSFADNLVAKTNVLVDTLEDENSNTLTGLFQQNKKEEDSILNQFNLKNNDVQATTLFENKNDEPVNNLFDTAVNTEVLNTKSENQLGSYTASYEKNDLVLVDETEEVETIIDVIKPSSLNDFLKPKTVSEVLNNKSYKTFGESITLNDKFIFVRELFSNQFSEYDAALKHIDTLENLQVAEHYCNHTLWNKFNWTEKGSAAARFLDLLKAKFDK